MISVFPIDDSGKFYHLKRGFVYNCYCYCGNYMFYTPFQYTSEIFYRLKQGCYKGATRIKYRCIYSETSNIGRWNFTKCLKCKKIYFFYCGRTWMNKRTGLHYVYSVLPGDTFIDLVDFDYIKVEK